MEGSFARNMIKYWNSLNKPAVLACLIVLLSEVIPHLETVGAEAASSSGISHNRLYSDKSLKTFDPYDDDFGKDSSRSKAFERSGVASGRPLAANERDSLADFRDKTGCPPAFEGLCRCGYDHVPTLGQKYVVNCTNAGFSTVDPLQSLPQQTEALVFTGNCIESLPSNIFGNTRTYPELVYIDLSSNGIKNILGKTFHKVSATQVLMLNNNKISRNTLHIHKRIFSNFVNLKYLQLSSAFDTNPDLIADLSEVFIESNLTKLEKLHLEHNEIDYISEPRILCELPSLMDLHLAQNRFTDLNLDITCLSRMRYIEVTDNDIRTISENSGLWKLLHEKNHEGKPIQVNLWENKFECDCRLDRFLAMVRNWTKVDPDVLPYGDKLTCLNGLPKNNTGQFLKDVMYTECPLLQASDYGSTAVSVIGWILGIMFLIGISYFMYANQNLICRPVSPLHQTTTQGVKYTTIQEEEAEVAHV